jgi:anaerobic selenocysteine-containing dehydrogenase
MVVFEQFMTDTAAYADIVLPSTSQLEHADIHNAYGHMYVAWNEPAVEPPGECLSTTELFRRLAGKMGLSHPCLYSSDEDMAQDLLSSNDPAVQGITLAQLKERGWMRLNYPEDSALFAHGFLTPSGKLEFVSEQMAADGLDPVAGYTPPHETTQHGTKLSEKYPLALIAHARHYSVNSIFLNSAIHLRRQGDVVALIHPDDASQRDLRTGMVVRIFNDRGEFRAPIQVSDKVRPGIVSTLKCGWPGLDPFGSSVNATVNERDADMGGGATFHDNRVEVASVDGPGRDWPA